MRIIFILKFYFVYLLILNCRMFCKKIGLFKYFARTIGIIKDYIVLVIGAGCSWPVRSQ